MSGRSAVRLQATLVTKPITVPTGKAKFDTDEQQMKLDRKKRPG